MRDTIRSHCLARRGFVFGYDTGQISGFLAMPDFVRRFGQRHINGETPEYYFSNARSGLIINSIRYVLGTISKAQPSSSALGWRWHRLQYYLCLLLHFRIRGNLGPDDMDNPRRTLPSRYRAKAIALSTASNWLWNFLLAFFTPFITSAIDSRYSCVFAGCNVLAGFTTLSNCPRDYFFVIEGQGHTLEEIDTMYLLGVKPWESAKWVMPDRDELDAKTRRALEETNPTNPDITAAAQRKSNGVDGSEKMAKKEMEVYMVLSHCGGRCGNTRSRPVTGRGYL
ncbi:hypothetical protein P171DRAFT_474104 [Karstenula rhodostoma CBS 690.94]|uniref:Uncharacterized protein n=1 Tax=Karstenula rhodostoma CBS 690.94 TaxID=1392251 RepID=A0A9P4PCW6_9PLEO|nr:hypothetical protein P171DRAFT_474104 [Karstenula rhodostoma CBS 690.94]